MVAKMTFRKSRTPFVFLVLTMVAFLLAEMFPWVGSRDGSFWSYTTGKHASVALVFFLAGISTKLPSVRAAGSSWKISLFIHTFNFGFFPIFVRVAVFLFSFLGPIDQWIVKGFSTLACMPPPLYSAYILTKVGGGNDVTAILNSAVGTLMGIFLTPILLLIHLGMSSTIPVQRTAIWVLLAGMLPALLGYTIRQLPWPPVPKRMDQLVWHAALLFVIFTSFCEIFQQGEFTVGASEFLVIVIIVLMVQICLILLSVRLATSLLSVDGNNAVAVLFCSTHKSLTLGLPIIKTLFGGYSHASQMVLPLLVYHPVQLILGSLIAPYAVAFCARYTTQRDYLPT